MAHLTRETPSPQWVALDKNEGIVKKPECGVPKVKNELQHLALNQGVQKKRKLWSEAGQQLLPARVASTVFNKR